jgi:hypothetical protein
MVYFAWSKQRKAKGGEIKSEVKEGRNVKTEEGKKALRKKVRETERGRKRERKKGRKTERKEKESEVV